MKAHKDKIRATFYIDKKLYQLLKRCSQIEEIPMSSIINDDILKERVRQYEFSTPEEWENVEYCEMREAEDHAQDFEFEAYEASPQGKHSIRLHSIDKLLKENRISEEDAQKQRLEAERKLKEEEDKEFQEEQQRKKALQERWIKAVSELPID
jgi:hypothetical protein